MKQRQMARLLGISDSYMTDLVKGIRTPSLILAFRIELATDGQVTAVSWVADELMAATPSDRDVA